LGTWLFEHLAFANLLLRRNTPPSPQNPLLEKLVSLSWGTLFFQTFRLKNVAPGEFVFETLEAETQLGNLTKSYEKLPIWAIWATGFQLKGALSSTCKTPSQTQNLEQLVTTLWRPVVPLRRVPSTREDRSIYADVYPCLSMFMHFAVKAAALSVCAKLQEDTNEHSRRRQ
jgi:hypothetical protein